MPIQPMTLTDAIERVEVYFSEAFPFGKNKGRFNGTVYAHHPNVRHPYELSTISYWPSWTGN